MKRNLLVGFVLIILTIISCSINKYPTKFAYSPEKPQAGSEIEIRYKSDNTDINNAEDLQLLVYSFSNELYNTEKYNMTKDGEGWTTKISVNDTTKGVILKFTSENGADDNDELGYVIKMSDADGNEVYGANAGLGSVYSRYANAIDLLASKDSASKYFDLDFAKNPELKKTYAYDYIASFPRSQRASIEMNEIERIEKEENFSQKDLEVLTNGYRNNGEHAKSLKYYDILKDKYPKSKNVTAKYLGRFRNMVTSERMMEVFSEFVKINPESDLNNYMVRRIVNRFTADKDYQNVQKMLDQYQKYTTSNVYNSIAWKLYETGVNLDEAVKYCEEGIKKARSEYESPSGEKPVYLAAEDWKNSKKYSLAMILDTYGSIQNKLDKKTEALSVFKEAVELTDKDEPEVNNNYVSLLFDMEKYDEAKVLIEEEIGKGKATDNMRNILSEIFKKQGGSEEKFDEYIGEFDGKAKEDLAKKLKDEMKNDPAPDFELVNMEGKTVKLSDYKGKTVILDFWATWCGPCLQSFPVMKKAVEKYSNVSDVEFLFINTWERVEDKRKNAEDFLKSTKYPFHVLLDDQNLVVEKYNVQGIPTKFIIDGNSNIRFQSVGFSGVESEVLEELDQMIAMIK